MSNPHRNEPCQEYGCKLEDATHVVILVHGRNQEPQFMAEEIVRPLDLDTVHYVAPTAANQTWYPMGFMAEFEDNEPWLGYTMDCIHAIVENLGDKGWTAEKVVLVGFSQGACVVCEYISRYPARYRGAAVLTGGLIGPEGSSWPGDSLEGTPMLLATSDIDPWIPLHRAEETCKALQARAANVDFQVYEGMEHTINSEEIDKLRKLICE